MFHADSAKAPRLASWLVTLFAPPDLLQYLVGDLQEEFHELRIRCGLGAARRWYWRQTFKTIAHLIGGALRTSPVSLVAIVAGGFGSIGPEMRLVSHSMQVFLDSHRLYESHPAFYLFCFHFLLPITGVVLCGLTGALVALLAHRREMVACTAIALLQILLFVAGTVALIVNGHHWLDWFLVMLRWNSLSALAILIGGIPVSVYRSRAYHRRASQFV